MKKIVSLFVLVLLTASVFATTIYDVQYTENEGDGTYPSEMVDQEVTLEGIVVATGWAGYGGHFYISSPEGGAWNGILVYGASDSTLVAGDEVSVTGTVMEYYGFTEIGDVTNVELLSQGNAVPNPVEVSCSELATEEMYESVFVSISDVTVLQEQDDYGQWIVQDDSGACQIDDGFFYLDEVDPVIEINVGDTWANISGMVDYSYSEYGLSPRTPEDMNQTTVADNQVSSGLVLRGNYPNPFNPETTIEFSVENTGHVELDIYNILGQKVKTLVDGNVEAGTKLVKWEGKDNNNQPVSSGVYFYKIRKGRYTSTKKMILMK